MSDDTLSRRQFVQIGAGVGMATAGIGTAAAQEGEGETADGESCNPEERVDCTWSGEPDYGVSYLIGRVKEHFSGFGTEEDYEEAEARSLYLQARSDAKIIKSGNKSVLTTLENLVANAKNVAYQQGRAALLEAINNGETPLNAIVPATKAIEEYIAPNQKNLVERYNVATAQIELQKDRAEETPNIGPRSLWVAKNEDKKKLWSSTKTCTFVDGETEEYRIYRHNAHGCYFSGCGKPDTYKYGMDTFGGGDYRRQGRGGGLQMYFRADSESDRGAINNVLQAGRFHSVWNDLQTAYNEAVSEIETFAEEINAEQVAGEISVEDITTPQDLWQMSSEDTENPYAAADLAGLGLEVNQSSSVTIDLLDDQVLLDGSVYLSESPIGESLTVGTVYDPAKSVETDSEGNPLDYAGTEADPIPLDGLSYIAYNTADGGSTYSLIQQPFEVVDAIGKDGETLDEVGYEPAGGQQTTTTDIDELKKELEAMNEEIVRLEDERREAATGGGISLGLGGDLPMQAVGTVVAVLAVLFALGGGTS